MPLKKPLSQELLHIYNFILGSAHVPPALFHRRRFFNECRALVEKALLRAETHTMT
jgi:hypothetical protein